MSILKVKPLKRVSDLFLGNTRGTRFFYIMVSDDDENIVVADDIQDPIYDRYDVVKINGKKFEVLDATSNEYFIINGYYLDNFDGWYKVI